MRTLQEVAETLGERGIFTGGPVKDFELVGRMQFALMIREGIYPWSKVLDIGCGCLRGGYWMIHFLNPGCYFGIEPAVSMVKTGLAELIEPEVLHEKCPNIDHNALFDTSVFGVKFDAFLCRSIWSHAAKGQIETMLDNFLRDSTPNAFFLTSYLPARWFWEDYKGSEYRGRSHECNVCALIKHRRAWIEDTCGKRGLGVVELSDGVVNDQKWLKIARLTRG